ncbi:hypothetical protein [Erwinia sorbitola]|uniref:Uncharacterized protein n=1 Tax=Erwinia sorbitola TaxID=2681984 RepID=A0A6I6EFD9_9GAMM|nr:hypothetical protein [Erwinia sorbitola]MTD26199.1 hypothetical protein [Erwinia sorbitola]QGU87268.1 hypothetical protein GN242_08610 [Erwinia sorbitola]
MYISDEDENQHVIIGEAAMNLIFSREEISLGSLINQLQSMASAEEDDDRLLKIWEARRWLLEYKKGSLALPADNLWLSSPGHHSDPVSKESDINMSIFAKTDKSKS